MAGIFQKRNSAALAWMVTAAFWFVIGTIYGLFSAIHLMAPEFFNNIAPLVFGRTRPAHVNTVAFGFVVTTLIGCGLYYLPALLKTRLWSERLGWASLLFWTVTVASGPITFAFGDSQGREYCEYVWWADYSLMLALLTLLVNGVMTIATRHEKILYVSTWYLIGAILWTCGTYPIGNVMWNPPTGAATGIMDSIFLWFWGHDLPGLLLTPLAVGAAYYVVPRVVRAPLYSHTLSIAGFWFLVLLYTHIGGHHLLQAPIPSWLKVVSVIDSVAMVIPVFIVLVNLFLTCRGLGGRIWGDPAGRFVIVGLIWYLFTCIQGPVQSLPAVQRVTHFNNWTIGHSHIAILGFTGYIALGAFWHILPLATGRRVWSARLINVQFVLITIGLTGFFLVLTAAGLIQGGAWANGEVVYRVLPWIFPYMGLRAMLGLFIITAAFVGFVNLVMTLRHGPAAQPDNGLEPFQREGSA